MGTFRIKRPTVEEAEIKLSEAKGSLSETIYKKNKKLSKLANDFLEKNKARNNGRPYGVMAKTLDMLKE